MLRTMTIPTAGEPDLTSTATPTSPSQLDPHEHPHDHPSERRLATVDAAMDAGHARAHADVWLSDVSAGYDGRAALEHVDVAIEAGSLPPVGGANGAGQSTLPQPGARLARARAAGPALFLPGEPVTGIDATTQEDLMNILEGEARHGKTVVATTHDLACAAQRFQRVLVVNRTVIAHGPSSLVLDPNVLARAYGGHPPILGGQTGLLADAHHHHEAAGG